MDEFQVAIAALSAVVLFLYGLQGFSSELQKLGGVALKEWLSRVTANRWYGFAIGAACTALVQSSSATTSLAVALVDAGIIRFGGSLGILLGANVGTTATAWLVSMKLTGIGPICIVAGTLIGALPWRGSMVGKAIFYFGLVFFALDLIGGALRPLQQAPWFSDALLHARSPIIGIALGALFTALVQSSSVTTGLAIVLVQQAMLPVDAAVAIVVGANVGSTSTALLSSVAMSPAARDTAVANLLFNLTGAILFMPLIGALSAQLGAATSAAMAVATAHLLFNLGIALLFLPILPRVEALVARWRRTGVG